ncbi:hypothetical protein PS467_08295 [Streptomyces luomodiensis]|uniref:Transposase n=1 Tax=Streptomyces luomodiensis TaxID=3026192 RepID=A0ABY9US17_9ACTN|nr:hypothetical protein [Streptomyces sp. SCA4-21]WNE95352.1 hypothetical protein PS467_08295 [Streptomyces sp. SCA4-21]
MAAACVQAADVRHLLIGELEAGIDAQAGPPRTRLRNKMLAAAALQAGTSRRLTRLGKGKPSKAPYSPAVALLLERLVRARRRRGYLTWLRRAA